MKKFLFLGVFFFFSFLFSAEPPDEGELPEGSEIPHDYVFEFIRESDDSIYKAPKNRGNGSGSNKDHETQGIAAIEEDYWILSKNKFIDTFIFDEYDYFSDDDKVDNFNPNDKAGDIDFSDGFLYSPDDKLRVYKWLSNSEDYADVAEIDWPYGLPFAAVFPETKLVFTDFDKSDSSLKGRRILVEQEKWTIDNLGYRIHFENKSGDDHNPCSIGSSDYCTQGAVFSPNGRFIFYVRDDSDDENANHTGIYVYYISNEDFLKLKNNEQFAKATFVGFENMKYDPDNGVCRRDELEGIEVSSLGNYDIHQLKLLNTCSTKDEKHSIYHWKSGDYDKDGVKDINDNCPFVSNRKQGDLNKDGIGDVCHDSDDDGVFDDSDNCINTPNPDQYDWNNDRVGDACQDFDDDGWIDYKDVCPDKVNSDLTDNVRNMSCRGDYDSLDCVSRRDLCDMDGDGRWDLEPEEEYEIDEYAYSASGSWSKSCDGNVRITGGGGDSFGGIWFGTQERGNTLSVEQRASYFCDQTNEDGSVTDSNLSAYYCYCGYSEDEHEKCSKNERCGETHANPSEAWNNTEGKSTWQPIFSEFKKIETSEACKFGEKIRKISNPQTWEYQKDNYLMNLIDKDNGLIPYAETEDDKNEINDYPMLKLARGAVDSDRDYILKIFGQNTKNMDKYYFSNYDQDHVSGENENGKLKLAKRDADFVDLIIERTSYVKVIIIPGYGKWWYNMMRDFIGYNPLDDLGQRELGFQDIVKDSIYESISRPSIFSRVGFDGDEIKTTEVSFNGNYDQIFAYGGRNAAYYNKNGEYNLAFTDVNGTFNDVNSVTRGLGMRSAAVAVSGTEIFMAAGYSDSSIRARSLDTENAELQPQRTGSFVKISFDDNEAYMVELASLPWVPVNVSLLSIEGRIHAVMTDENGQGQILTYYSENNDWEPLTDFDFGKAFSLNNTFVKDQELYFTAPGPNDQNTLYSWSDGNGVNEVASLDISYDAFIKPLNSGDRIILADFKNISEGIETWELKDGEFTPVTIEIDRPEYDRSFCIREKDDSIFPGATNHRGECISVYDYNDETVSYFDYKRTVAGHYNNLYLGGLSGVRRVEIRADGTLKNRELLTTGEIHNLAKYKNTLYGANGGEVEIFSIAEDGSITEVADFDASACRNIRINDGILFTAEKNRVRVFDLADPTDPQLIKTISTAGKVNDLEVIGKTLYIYEETTSWFTTKGYTGIYDISDLDSPVRTGHFKRRCKDAEMQRSGETVHLGCKNGQYIVEDTGLVEVSGENNYVREGYVYDGILYQVFSGALHKSKTTGIEIVCGNGIVEPGEACDSDTLQCSELDDDYVDGTATCNSTCSGHNESGCEIDDGW